MRSNPPSLMSHSSPPHLIIERLVVVSLSCHLSHLPCQDLVKEREKFSDKNTNVAIAKLPLGAGLICAM